MNKKVLFKELETDKNIQWAQLLRTGHFKYGYYGDLDVFIAPDESYIIFASQRRDGKGMGDLYISFKNEVGEWKQAVNMDRGISTDKHELCPYVTKDGKYFFYTSNQDIYWISTEIFDDYKDSM